MPYRNPDEQRAAKRESARRKRGVCGTTRRTLPSLKALRVRTAADCLDVLNDTLNEVRGEQDMKVVERARLVVYIVSAAIRCIEVSDLADRLEQLEAQAEKLRSAA